jgi:capsular polysaccharide biosynthesis protein
MQEINLYKLLGFYVRNWLLILSLTLTGLLAGVVYNQFIQQPMYRSNATLLFINPGSSTSAQDATLLSNYVALFQSRRVLEPVISAQKLGVTYDQFSPSVDAVNEKGTEVIKLSVTTDSAEKSQKFLQSAVSSFKKEATLLYDTDKLQVVDNASSAAPPFNVKKPLQLALATGAGFVISLIVLFFIFDAKGGQVEKKPVLNKPKAKQPVKRTKRSKAAKLVRKSSNKPAITTSIKRYFTEPNDDYILNPPKKAFDSTETKKVKNNKTK